MTFRKAIIGLAAVLAAMPVYAVQAHDREETCTSTPRATGTIVTECRAPGRKPRHCESYTNITGTTTTECR